MKASLFSRLTFAIKEEIAKSAQTSFIKASDIADTIYNSQSDLVSQLGEKLVLEAISSIARREIKKWTAIGRASVEPLVFPEFHFGSNIPPAVWVPDNENDERGIYRSLGGESPITVLELKKAVDYLKKQIENDTIKMRALEELLEIVLAKGAKDNDNILDILKSLPSSIREWITKEIVE